MNETRDLRRRVLIQTLIQTYLERVSHIHVKGFDPDLLRRYPKSHLVQIQLVMFGYGSTVWTIPLRPLRDLGIGPTMMVYTMVENNHIRA